MQAPTNKNRAGNSYQDLWHEYQWLVVGLAGLLALILGFIGYQGYFLGVAQPLSVWDTTYFTLQLFTLDFHTASGPIPWELQIARFLAPGVVVFTALKAILVIFREQLQLFRLRFMRDHVVICGLDKMGQLLASAFCDQGYRVVCLNLKNLNSDIDQLRNHGAIVLTAQANTSKLLRRARVNRANHLIAVSDDDGINADIAVQARSLARHRTTGILNCFIHISDRELVSLLKEKEIETQQSDAIRVNFFNLHYSGARALLQAYPPFELNQNDSDPPPHLLLVGLGQLGESLLLRAAWLWNIANVQHHKLKITIIDSEADRKFSGIAAQNPNLTRVCDFEVIEMTIPSAEFNRGDFPGNSITGTKISKIYVCLGSDSDGLSAALALRRQLPVESIPTVVCMQHKTGLATLLQGNSGRDFDQLDAFGLLEQTCQPSLLLGGTHELLARAIHDDYVSKAKENGQTPDTNPSMVAWDDLPETLKDSNRRQSDHIGEKLKHAGCDIRPLSNWDAELYQFSESDIEYLAELEHARWNEDRFRDDWRYAPGDKNVEKKTSPWLVSWEKLPDNIKDYDRNAVRELPAFLAKAGFEVYKLEKG